MWWFLNSRALGRHQTAPVKSVICGGRSDWTVASERFWERCNPPPLEEFLGSHYLLNYWLLKYSGRGVVLVSPWSSGPWFQRVAHKWKTWIWKRGCRKKEGVENKRVSNSAVWDCQRTTNIKKKTKNKTLLTLSFSLVLLFWCWMKMVEQVEEEKLLGGTQCYNLKLQTTL